MSKDNYRCRGCIALGNYCGHCWWCKERIAAMYEGLLKIAARAEDSSSVDIRYGVADALGMTLAQLDEVLESGKEQP